MRTSAKASKIAAALGGFAVAGAAVVVACGPDFPLQLLDNRAGTLMNTPANSFAWEAAHLLVPADQLQADEGSMYEGQPEDAPGSLRMREKGALDAAGFARLKAMRGQSDGDAAYAAGDGLPPAIRLYTAAAQDYRAARADGQTQSASLYRRAQQRFEQVLALPQAQAAERAVWAAYMLGQIHAAQVGVAGMDAHALRRQAIDRYRQARKLAVDGAPDPLGLAVASYGEEARLHLVTDGRSCGWSDFENDQECAAAISPGELKQAIRLYAEQAVRGSANAIASLSSIAYWALKDADRSAPLLDDAPAQRLLVAYALARMGDIVDDSDQSVYAYDASSGAGASSFSGYADAARGPSDTGSKIKPNPVLVSLVDALRRRGMENIAGADRIAALAYRTGRYELAQALAQRQDSALAWWVRAKLTLRAGDSAGAAQAYARALQGFPRNDGSLDPANVTLLMGAQGVLTLSRGQYVEALDQFTQAARQAVRSDGGATYSISFISYINDMAYVAERVLTVDELKHYVDTHASASPMPAPDAVIRAARKDTGNISLTYAAQSLSPVTVDDRLRQLLARRLVRKGRVEEALPYFPDERDERFVTSTYDQNGKEVRVSWRVRAKAREYGQALDRARHAWRATTRAEGWYRAAQIARLQGMEIMGYEQAPDYGTYDGNYEYGAGPARYELSYTVAATGKSRPATPQARALADLPGPYVTDEERKRYADSEARPYKRFHYRDIAADYIMKAADDLPPRSQAFAAALCQGVNFVFYDAQSASRLYRRYVKEGAAVPFAADFGQNCVEPDFAAAARFPYGQAWRAARSWVASHRSASAAVLLAAVLGSTVGVTAFARQRRRKTPAG